jgi:hypothetical protein
MASLVTNKQPDDLVLVKRVRDHIKKLRRKLAKEEEGGDGAAWVSVTGVIGFDGAGELPRVTPSARWVPEAALACSDIGLRFEMRGDTGSPLAGAVVLIEALFPENWPFSPPLFAVVTKCFHPDLPPQLKPAEAQQEELSLRLRAAREQMHLAQDSTSSTPAGTGGCRHGLLSILEGVCPTCREEVLPHSVAHDLYFYLSKVRHEIHGYRELAASMGPLAAEPLHSQSEWSPWAGILETAKVRNLNAGVMLAEGRIEDYEAALRGSVN